MPKNGGTVVSVGDGFGLQIALLDKEKFPRDKYCGDAVCTPAIRILEEMGVMQELKANNEAHFADSGGFVSPSGISFIGASKEKLGQAAACAVKRINLDKRIAAAAKKAGLCARRMHAFCRSWLRRRQPDGGVQCCWGQVRCTGGAVDRVR